ncbi:hypothetical protein L195_g045175, partial [Trifolium pratense]
GSNAEDVAHFTTILWNIWKQRNNKVWNNTVDAQGLIAVTGASMKGGTTLYLITISISELGFHLMLTA